MSLSTLSAARADLPVFPGATLPEQLINGRNAALAALREYRPNLAFDVAQARENFAQVDAWMERNSGDLKATLEDPRVETLPERVKTAFNSDTAQNFVIAGFTIAAEGLGPWTSGAVAANLSESFARSDASDRLAVFGSVVKMKQSGYLDRLFRPQATSGFGLAPVVVWAIAVTTVLLASLLLTYLYRCKQLEMNNRTMRDLCEKAQASGDQKTVADCVAATKDLQVGDDMFGVASIGKAIVVGAVLLGGLYLAATLLPEMLAKRATSRRTA